MPSKVREPCPIPLSLWGFDELSLDQREVDSRARLCQRHLSPSFPPTSTNLSLKDEALPSHSPPGSPPLFHRCIRIHQRRLETRSTLHEIPRKARKRSAAGRSSSSSSLFLLLLRPSSLHRPSFNEEETILQRDRSRSAGYVEPEHVYGYGD